MHSIKPMLSTLSATATIFIFYVYICCGLACDNVTIWLANSLVSMQTAKAREVFIMLISALSNSVEVVRTVNSCCS